MRYLLLHQLPSYLVHFALGILLGRAWLQWRASGEALIDRAMVAIAAACAFAVLYRLMAVDGRMLGALSWIVPPLCLGLLLFWSVTTRWTLVQRVLARGPLAFLGRVSYSAYLYHLPALLLWNAYARSIPRWLSLPLYLAALLVISWTSWRFVEQPFLRKSGVRYNLKSRT